jgi:hypothetical protein
MSWVALSEEIGYELDNQALMYTGVFLCKILGFRGGDYEECRLLGCGAV